MILLLSWANRGIESLMRVPLILLTVVLLLSVSGPVYTQRSKTPLVCKTATLAALKTRPELSYQCDDRLNDYDEKILKLPARVAAIKSLVTELSSFTEPAWWAADVVDLGVCDYTGKAGTLTRDQRQSFVAGEYLFWLFGNDRIRLVLIPDPCYQREYGGANGFLLYRHGGRVSVTQVLDGFFSRADNPVNLAFAKLNGEEIVEISTWSGGLNPSLTNYYFVIDPKTSHAMPKNLFKGDRGPTNEISSAMRFNEAPASAPLKIVRGQTMAPSFSIYVDDEHGKIDDNGRTLSRKILRWNGKIYR
jgi:hypothetical protein